MALVLTEAMMGQSMAASGTYDLDRDGLSEMLLLNRKDSAPLDYVEIDSSGRHQSLWTYTPPESFSGRFSDAALVDLDNDSIPEIVAISILYARDPAPNTPWIHIFKWEDTTYSKQPLLVSNDRLNRDRVRPSNLAVIPGPEGPIVAVALSSPARNVALLRVTLSPTGTELHPVLTLKPDLLKNGYGQVFTGIIESQGRTLLAVFSPESNLLKTTVYTLSITETGAIESEEWMTDVLVLNGARRLFGPGITSMDDDGDGDRDLVLPFLNGEVLTLSEIDGGVALVPSNFTRKGLFVIPATASDDLINQTVLFRVEERLSRSSIETTEQEIAAQVFAEDLPNIPVIDTLVLGESFSYPVYSDSVDGFYSFTWLENPPMRFRFDPEEKMIRWTPSGDQLGVHVLSYQLESRLYEKVIRMEDAMGDRHQVVPILDTVLVSFGIRVMDSVQVQEVIIPPIATWAPLPQEIYQVQVLQPDQPEESRFTFEGEAPFSVNVFELPDFLGVGRTGHTVFANLATIDRDKQVQFAYHSEDGPEADITTVSMTHDLSTNVVVMSFDPALDTIPQSFEPEAWDPDLYAYPEFFFEGFPTSMRMDSVRGMIRFSMDSSDRPKGAKTYLIFGSPTKPTQSLILHLDGGSLQDVRGEIKVHEDGTKKLISHVTFHGKVVPIIMDVRLQSEEEPDSIRFWNLERLLSDLTPEGSKVKRVPADPSAKDTTVSEVVQEESLTDPALLPIDTLSHTEEQVKGPEDSTPEMESISSDTGETGLQDLPVDEATPPPVIIETDTVDTTNGVSVTETATADTNGIPASEFNAPDTAASDTITEIMDAEEPLNEEEGETEAFPAEPPTP